jgi:two-component system chemotaxis response regulator CheB
MAVRDIVIVGGSAGSVDALKTIVRDLPIGLSAAVFVVIHLSPRQRNYLAELLGQISRIPVQEAIDNAPIVRGQIYVAPPDRHLLIKEDHMHLWRGPKEGLQRPSINVTLRSAAAAYGNRVIAVLLSGLLDDGAAGLWEVSNRGGVTIVQDPAEAPFPSMPLNALESVNIDFRLRSTEIGAVMDDLINGKVQPPSESSNKPADARSEMFSGLTCPECHGPLYTLKKPGPLEFRCRVGHVMSLGTLLNESSSTQERKLYEALLAMQEGADLADLVAQQAADDVRNRFIEEAKQLRAHADTLRRIIETRDEPGLP